MRIFIIKSLIFSAPILFLMLIEIILPLETFTYRPWEALRYNSKNGIAFPFIPNQRIKMHAVGDLCHHTKYQVSKYENWQTDSLGFRNEKFIKKPDIIILGDSFIAGSGLPQDSTINCLLEKKTKRKVYGMAPFSFPEFVSLMNQGVISEPKILILGVAENHIPPPLFLSTDLYNSSNLEKTSIIKEKMTRLYSINYLKSRLLQLQGKGIKGFNSDMFFENGASQYYPYEKIDKISETILQYKIFCDSKGINFIFLPLPKKETIYFDFIPLNNQPGFILKLESKLKDKGVTTIRTIETLNERKKDRLLYHLDDTHWNSNGVNLISEILIKEINL
jgi:hypothetical protein